MSAGALDLAKVGFSGPGLDALRKRPAKKSPFALLMPPEPGLIALIARAMAGKTSFAAYLAQAWVCGVSPWVGAPALPGSRALILSAEQPAERIDATLRRMDTLSENVTREKWTERLTLIARDPELPRSAARMFTLDAIGRALLRQGLLRALREGKPYGFVVLDSLSRLVPDGLDENSNSEITAWLASLQELAEELSVYVLVIHHVGHAEGRNEARTAGRGASAIAAVAQAVWLLENVGDNPRQRKLHVQGNAVPETRITFSVSSEESDPGKILYWRPTDPLAAYNLADLVGENEEITTSELAARLQEPPPDEGQRAGSVAHRLATKLRTEWQRVGLIEVREGPHRSKLLRLKRHDETEKLP